MNKQTPKRKPMQEAEALAFSQYLAGRQLSPKSIDTYQGYQSVFNTWLIAEGLESTAITYTDLLNFISHSQGRGLTPDYIMKLLGAIRHYFNYLKYIGQIKTNPANGLYIRGQRRRIPHDLLTSDQLESMYHSFTPRGLTGKRNKMMLGMLIYQGLTTHEIERLETTHLRLREGKIAIPGSSRSHGRTLPLEAHQVLALQEYMSKTRQLLLEIAEKPSDRLFVSMGSSDRLRGSIDKLMSTLRKRYEYFINAGQLRQSRLALWIKQYDLRQAQYMAGHKYVSSTERYQGTNLEDLQKELEKHHPSTG
jgi:integrase/recombinase XerD